MNPQIDTQLYNRLAETGAFGEKPQLPTTTVPTPSNTTSPTTSSNVVITPESLQTEPSLVIPPPVNSTTAQNKFAASLGAGVGVIEKNQSEQAEMDKIKAQNPREENLKGVQKLLADIGLKGQRTQEIQEDFAVSAKRKAAKDLENEILSFDKEWKTRIEAQRKAVGGTTGGTSDSLTAMEREYNSQRADKLIAYKILNDDYLGAKTSAQEAIDAEFEPLENELQSRFQLFNVLNNDLSESESIELQADLDLQKKEIEDFKQAKSDFADAAIQMGNVAAIEEIRKAKTADEVRAIAGKYRLVTLDDRVKESTLAKNRLEQAKLNAEIAQMGTEQYTPKQLKTITSINDAVSKNATYAKTSSMRTYGDNVLNSLALENGVSDIAAINQFQKVIDEGAVTRDQDVKLIQGAQSLLGTFKLTAERAAKGDQLSDSQRKQMRELVTKLYEAQVKALLKDPYITAKTKEVELNGLTIQDTILGELGAFSKTGSETVDEVESLSDDDAYQLYLNATQSLPPTQAPQPTKPQSTQAGQLFEGYQPVSLNSIFK